MKRFNSTFLYFVFFYSSVFSQEKEISGVVKFNGTRIADVEVVSVNAKQIVKSNAEGEFLILAKMKETLIFYSKRFLVKKVIVNDEIFNQGKIIVTLEEKPIELNEIEVKRTPENKIDVSYEALKASKIEKDVLRPNVVGVYTGEIVNGMDFIEIGKKIFKLFRKKENDGENKVEKTNFRQYVKNNFSDDFFSKDLHLKTEEIPLFIDFCALDVYSSEVIYKNGILDVIEFLLTKRKEFKN
ncbi:hypothetical protein EQG63_11680 [Flavobacterium amnicola]|uniref:Carboxypeptidase-like regulatory domain-containing protein n=1 Tax=Flavobacterium amnicola TaxID=2506422 RepID=A0A4Q1K311_9FLAO|nr:hypothetical protein [Flavobacterium amnicola]RXR16279.1 hypothetical protein EQG63_11680 [Flavobacterium amnicola]